MNQDRGQYVGQSQASLKIRPLVAGPDDGAYLSIMNRIAEEFPDQTPIAQDELVANRTMPYFDTHGQFVAELDGRVVGIGFGEMNPLDSQRVGWVSASVLPEFRRRHVGTALAEVALHGLRARGAKRLLADTREGNSAGDAFLRSLGFRVCRSESWMRRSLEHLPTGVGENTEVEIREVTLNGDNLRLTTELINEVFKEDWDFVPVTVEARQKRLAEFASQGRIVQTLLAMFEGQAVGQVQADISPRKIAALKVQRGGLLGLGVLKPFRNQGIAKALMIRGLQFLKAREMSEAELFVDDVNPARALDIYLKLGFQVVRKILAYELPV